MNDYSFMDTDYEKAVSELVDSELEYIDKLLNDESGEAEYDDDYVFDMLVNKMKKDFSEYSMYIECMVDDYLEVSEKYLSEKGDIEWD